MITFENVIKSYGRKRALDGLNLKIGAGEFLSVIGESGAGKSTLIQLMIGDEKADKGKIVVDGYEVNKMNSATLQYYRRKVGVVFQDYKLLERKTVYENVAFALEVCGYEDAEIFKKVMSVLKTCGIETKAHKFPHELSGGEKQRVAIARALVHEPSVILADEPTGNLDPQNAMQILELLDAINKDGTTVVLTTHNKELVNKMKKRVVVLREGKLHTDKKTAEYSLN